jgi:hypothetical protein
LGRRLTRGISTYIETFTLIGIAVAGTAIVYSTTAGYSASAGGASVALSGVVLSQGQYVAVEKLIIENTGTVPIGSFVISAAIPANPSYCMTLTSTNSGPVPFSSPPAACGSSTSVNPGSIGVSLVQSAPPGVALLMTVNIFSGTEFAVGMQYTVTVTVSGGASQLVASTAVPG